MALLPTKKDFCADDEVIRRDTLALTQETAIKVQRELLKKWEPKYEIWPLKYGPIISGVTCSISTLIIHSLFRRKLKLRIGDHAVTTAAMAVGPALLTSFAHEEVILRDILLYTADCKICTMLKGSLILNFNAIFYPMILSPTISLANAGTIGLRIPYIYELKEIGKFWWSVVKPSLYHISLIFFLNSAVTAVLIYQEYAAIERLTNILIKIREYAEKHKAKKYT